MPGQPNSGVVSWASVGLVQRPSTRVVPIADLLFPVENSHSPSFGDCELVLFD